MASVIGRALLVALLACPATAARAQDGSATDRLLEEGRRHYRELSYLDAIDVLRRALASPSLTDAQRVEGLEVLGSSYVVLDRDAEAREAFEALFAIDPYHLVREPSGSPKIARFVAGVRAALVPDAAIDPDVALRADLPRVGRVGRDTRVTLSASPPSAVDAVRLRVRGADDADWLDLAADGTGAGRWVAVIPGRDRTDELELYAVGRDASDRVVTRAGSPLSPLVLSIRLDDAAPLVEQWWLWTAIGGGVVAAVIVGVAVAVSTSSGAPPGTLPPGRVELP